MSDNHKWHLCEVRPFQDFQTTRFTLQYITLQWHITINKKNKFGSALKLNCSVLLKIAIWARRETQRILPHRNDIIRGFFFSDKVGNVLMKGIWTALGGGAVYEILGVLEMETYPFHLFFHSIMEQ